MMLLEWKTPQAAFGWSYLCGVVFFSALLYWLVYVDPLIAFFGFPLMVLYLSLYFGFFGLAYVYIRRKPVLGKIFLLPGSWVVLEYLRAHLFSGFDWGGLGYSQYKNLIAIQIADVTGIFGVSFLIVMINVVIKEFCEAGIFQSGIPRSEPLVAEFVEQMSVPFLAGEIINHGFSLLRKIPRQTSRIHGNFLII